MERLLKAAAKSYRKGLVRLVAASSRAALWVTSAGLVLSTALLYYAASHLSIDTNAADMLDPNLPFRRAMTEFERAFPQLTNLVVVVVQADSASLAEDAADKFAALLRQERGPFQSIYQPGKGSFFAHNGLLYLAKNELSDLSDRLTEAEPFLGALAEDASLHGLLTVLGRALGEGLSSGDQALLKKMLDELNQTAQALLEGKPQPRSWREALLQQGGPAAAGSHRSFVLVQPRLDYSSLRPATQALTVVRRLARDMEAQVRGVRLRLTGDVAIDDEQFATVSRGAGIATSLSFALVCLVLFLGLRSARLVVAVLGTLCIGLVWTAAFATVAIGHLNLISVTFAVLFIGLGVDFGIQFAMRFREEFATAKDHLSALTRAAAGVGGTLSLAALAAAISFFSFVPTSYRGLAELGIISGTSMIVALFANLTVLPALLTLMPVRDEPSRPAGNVIARLCLACFTVRRNRRSILALAAMGTAGSFLLLPQARFDFNPINLQDPTTQAVATFLGLLRDPGASPYTGEVLATNLAAAERLASRLDELPLVDKTVTLASFVPTDQDEKLRMLDDLSVVLQPLLTPSKRAARPRMHGEAMAVENFQNRLRAAGAGGDDFAASAARLARSLDQLKAMPDWPGRTLRALEANVLGDLPQVLDKLRLLLTPNRITLANLPEDIRQRYLTRDGRARIEAFPKQDLSDEQAMRRFARAVQSVAPNATGAPLDLVQGGDAVVTACLQAATVALIAASLLIAAALRSVSGMALVLLPLLLAAMLTVGGAVLFNLPFNLANIIALPLMLGLGIAFGIYLVMRRRAGLTVTQLFYSSTPRAVLFSALTTIVSFGSLAFSAHRGMSAMGQLLTLSLALTLASTLLVLPAVIAEMEQRS